MGTGNTTVKVRDVFAVKSLPSVTSTATVYSPSSKTPSAFSSFSGSVYVNSLSVTIGSTDSPLIVNSVISTLPPPVKNPVISSTL